MFHHMYSTYNVSKTWSANNAESPAVTEFGIYQMQVCPCFVEKRPQLAICRYFKNADILPQTQNVQAYDEFIIGINWRHSIISIA